MSQYPVQTWFGASLGPFLSPVLVNLGLKEKTFLCSFGVEMFVFLLVLFSTFTPLHFRGKYCTFEMKEII